MASSKPLILTAAAAVLTSGCLFAGDAKFPTLQMPQEQAATSEPAPAAPSPAPVVTPAKKSPEEIQEGLSSLGARLDLHAGDIESIQAGIADQRQRFESATDSVEAAASGSQSQTDRWNEAQIELTRLASQVERLTDLAESVRNDAGQLAELYAAAQTGGDESAHLATAGKLIAHAGMLLDQIRTDRATGERMVDGARERLAGLNPGAPKPQLPALPKNREAYVVFHLDRDDTGYEQTLRDAITQALSRKPDMSFDLYSVAGNAQDDVKAQDRAQDVKRIIRSMGVDEGRITLTEIREASDTTPEVRIYIR